ncbi:N-carbamoyl-L-amino-acid hydrolase [Rhodobium orientis]|uniref:Zn-dependent hydrolase n=1 Tax=Rhodobium orientis TaxID=34017 RepID=A0A327JNQ2_9HYPH|nr:M20 family metallo-hydrolase [Rhodobium orientis]MBB4304719.1 N-carbamoyl-L-amino-acid hydrolase [Rhodobium orientis]MBK5952077.1 Zn-dependent hydrolase [Rhodobium orientis]RAI26522.1 Zn-dependent hydrolase [Rhodobium orientis]
MITNHRIDLDRLMGRIRALGEVGSLPGGGVCRLALSDADKAGRDLVSGWMRDAGLAVTVDAIGNVVGSRKGETDGPMVLVGSHIDTVATGGLYDGNLGVLAGLEVIDVLNDLGLTTHHPVGVAFFTNEEGARFAPDMMGSGVHQGALSLETCLATAGIDGATVGEELQRIGYAGETPAGSVTPRAYFELHVEQGPVLEEAGIAIGAVTGVQGISWTEYTVAGVSNHAGTTPMRLRHDAGYVAAEIAVEARRIARDIGGDQVATAGAIELDPGLVNVIARSARITVDLRNTDDLLLREAEAQMAARVVELEKSEGVTIAARSLARFAPVGFDEAFVSLVAETAQKLGHTAMRMPSGAGHDAQMFAPNCPTAMVFVPSAGGISHNVEEYTAPDEIAAGANVLLQMVLSAAGR